MAHGHGAIRVFMPPHRDLHIMEPVGILRDLAARALIPHGIVLGDDPRLLHTQHLSEMRAEPRDEGGVRVRRPHHNPVVVRGKEPLGQVPIGRRHFRDPGQCPLFGQSGLHRVRQARADRPRASGEYAGMRVTPHCCHARWTCVGQLWSTWPPTSSVCQEPPVGAPEPRAPQPATSSWSRYRPASRHAPVARARGNADGPAPVPGLIQGHQAERLLDRHRAGRWGVRDADPAPPRPPPPHPGHSSGETSVRCSLTSPPPSCGSVVVAAHTAPQIASVSRVVRSPVSWWPALRAHPPPDRARATQTGQMCAIYMESRKDLP
jgi:hypothetical protein